VTTPKIGIDLSQLSLEDLRKINPIKGLPRNILDHVEMLTIIREDETLQPVEGADLSEDWTISTSPRTKLRILNLIHKG